VKFPASYAWIPIEDLPADAAALAKPELRELSLVWQEQRQALTDAAGWQDFLGRLKREWSIETGLLERIYTLDRGITQLLIERGLDASFIPHSKAGQDPEKVVAIIRDHESAIDSLFDFVKGDRRLSVSYIKELHALLTRNQEYVAAIDSMGRKLERPLLRGAFKKLPNNPLRANGTIHEYCPPEQVASEMDRLIELHLSHDTIATEVEAAWLHHRFTQIHPFEDGNGRVARSLATLVFHRAGWFPLVVRDIATERSSYLDALEDADAGDLGRLVQLFSSLQRRAFVQALGISGQVLRHAKAEQVIAAARDQLQARARETRREWEAVKPIAAHLHHVAKKRLSELSITLDQQTSQFLEGAHFFVDAEEANLPRWHYFRYQIIEIAQEWEYFANFSSYHSWIRLVLSDGGQSTILVSFHGAGREFRGVLVASACFFRREESEDGTRQVVDITRLGNELFQVNYRDRAEDAEERFRDWLEYVVAQGLEIWRKGL
jgi:fido (protein-threonine AMPylation protein)